MARPRKPKSECKRHRIVFRLADQQFLPLVQKAAALNISHHELAHDLTIAKIERLVVKVEGRPDPALVKQLYHIGHNLNQLVKNAHIFGRVSPQIEQLCKRIDALMDQAIGKGNE